MKKEHKCKTFNVGNEEIINSQFKIIKRILKCVECGREIIQMFQEFSDKEYENYFQEFLSKKDILTKDKLRHLQNQMYFDNFGFKRMVREVEGLCPNGHPIFKINQNISMCKCGYGWGGSN